MKEALNHGYHYANVRGERPEFTKEPGDYILEQVWACTFFEEFATNRFLEDVGHDRVLFETDSPHPICLYGDEVRTKIDAAFGELPQDVQRKVIFDNAAALYGVEAPDEPWNGGRAGA